MSVHRAVESFVRHRPDSWDVVPFRRLAVERGVRNAVLAEQALSLASSGRLYERTEDTDRQFGSEASERNRWVVHPGDLVVNPMWLLGGAIGVCDRRGAVSPDYRVYALSDRLQPRFLHHLLRSDPFRDQYRLYMRAETTFDRRVGKEDFGELPILVPPILVQRAIADYLDAETARIDDAITAIRQSLQLIAQYRRSLITEVFVQPAHPRRGSTVRVLADALLGRQRSPDQAEGPNMVPYLRAANVKDGRLDLDDVMEMNFNPREQQTFALVPGDVLITEGAGSLAAVGANAIWNGDLPGVICFQNTLIRLRPKEGSDPRFVGWWARHAFESGLLGSVAGGANIYHLGVETVRTLAAWTPPLGVQRQVADRLDREIASLQQQVAARRRQIDLLLERRQALITAAVTGQVELPGVAG